MTAPLSDRAIERLRRAATERAFPPNEGDVVDDRFELVETIGAGASGIVFRARDRLHDREVALKAVFGKDARADDRFAREAEALAALEHPSIVRYVAHGALDGGAGYLVTELLTGRTLAAHLREEQPSIDQSLDLCARVADGLGIVHAAGLVHRDVKPSNIFLCDDDFTKVKIIDFGIARREGTSELTKTGAIVGTPGYLAPEQARSREAVGPATDVFALGCVLFRCVTGQSPFEGDDVLSVALSTVLDDAPRVSARREDASDALDRLVAAMLAKNPAARPASRDLVRRIERVRRAPARSPRRWWILVPLLAAVAIAILLAGPKPTRLLAVPKVPRQTVIAVLPFEDETNEPRLDFSAAGLASLVGSELRRVPGVATVGYYRLAGDVRTADAPREQWLKAARAKGATLILRGRLARKGDRIESNLALVGIDDGNRVAEAARVSDIEGVPEAVRACVDDLARALGIEAKTRTQRPAALTVERATQLAVAEIEQYRLPRARLHLDAALITDPNAAEAHYWLAVVNWWEHHEEDALRSIELALKGELDEPRRGFLEALRELVGRDYPAALAMFRHLATRYPDDRDILYGLSEAYFHGGEPDRGVETYRALVASWPRFRLGLFHVFDRYRALGNADGLAWAIGRSDDDMRSLWAARAEIAKRKCKAALDLYYPMLESDTHVAYEVKREIIAAHALAGQLPLAESLAEELRSEHPIYAALALHGIAAARGRRADRQRWADTLVRDARSRPRGEDRFEILAPIALMTSARGDDTSPMEHEIADATRGTFVDRSDRAAALRVILGHKDAPKGPAADAAKKALWSKAADVASWGELIITFRFFLARASRDAKRHAEVISACDDVIRPRIFSWVWGELAPRCLLWTIEANRALGRDPQDALERLVSMRASTDPLVVAARKIDTPD